MAYLRILFLTHGVLVRFVRLQNKQPLFPYTALTDWFYYQGGLCLLRGTNFIFQMQFRLVLVFNGFEAQSIPLSNLKHFKDFTIRLLSL